MNKQQTELLKKLNTSLVTKTRDKGGVYFYCNDDKSKDYIRDIHGTNFFPCDFRFKVLAQIILDIVGNRLDASLDELREERDITIDGMVYYGNYDLIQWMGSNLKRIGYVDEALVDYTDGQDIMAAIRTGQYLEIDEIYGNLINVLATLE